MKKNQNRRSPLQFRAERLRELRLHDTRIAAVLGGLPNAVVGCDTTSVTTEIVDTGCVQTR